MEKRTRHFAAVACLILGTLLYTQLPASAPLEPAASSGEEPTFNRVPQSIDRWIGRDVTIDENAFTILTRDADAWIVREYRRDREMMWLSMVMTRDQRKLFRVHIPDICLPAQGWSVLDRSPQKIQIGPQGTVTATKLIAQKGNITSQVLYWFTSNNRAVESKMLHRLLLVWDGVMGERTPGTLIQVSAPILRGDWKETLRLQTNFIRTMSPYFPEIRRMRQGS